jgi:membrane-bound lytic murein transglycosylase B
MARTSTNADGSNLARRLAKDAALRRTLAKLRSARAGVPASSVVVGGSVADIPAVALTAYQRAATEADRVNPGCDISWTLVAGIGRVESDHGTNGGSAIAANGEVRPAILGPVLDGSDGNAAITDTDHGRLDGDARWDRAVGPMQFIPSTWATWGRDGNGDGVIDPENIFDAARATADYLCASGGDLNTPDGAERAVLSYNHSLDYVLVVLGYASAYGGQDLTPVSTEIAQYLAALAKSHATTAKHPVKKPVKAAKKPAKPAAKPSSSTSPHPAVTPSRTASPRPSVKPKPKPTKSVRPTWTPRPTPSRTPTPSPTPTPTVTPSATATSALGSASATP